MRIESFIMPWTDLAVTYAEVVVVGSVAWGLFVCLLAWRQR